MKDRQGSHEWNDQDETDFIQILERELDKVVVFQESKVQLQLAHWRRPSLITDTWCGCGPDK